MHREGRKSNRTEEQSKAAKKGKPARKQVGEDRKGAVEDPAEGGEGAPIGRALGAPQSDAEVEAGRREEQLRPRALRQEP